MEAWQQSRLSHTHTGLTDPLTDSLTDLLTENVTRRQPVQCQEAGGSGASLTHTD